jgi:phospholipid transport system substrate-binding protein
MTTFSALAGSPASEANKMSIKKLWLGSVLTLCILSISAESQTATELEPLDPIAFLRNHDAQVKDLLSQAPQDTLPVELRNTLKERINAAFDFSELSKLALGTHWQERTPDQRTHFIDTFSGIIKEQNFDSFLRYYREGNITYKSQEIVAGKAMVKASVPLKREQVEIVYSLHQVDDQWHIYDLSIDGASTAEGNRRRYARYIKKNTYERLIQQLDKQLAQLLENGS